MIIINIFPYTGIFVFQLYFKMEYEYIGAIKIRDGLFLGDQFAAQDLEFVVTNKVTKIINCAGKQIPNHWESIGIAYLTFPWFDNETQVFHDIYCR